MQPEGKALCRAMAASLRQAAEDVERAGDDDGQPQRLGSALARLEELTPRLVGLAKATERSRIRERESA